MVILIFFNNFILSKRWYDEELCCTNCRWLDSNRGPLMSEAVDLPLSHKPLSIHDAKSWIYFLTLNFIVILSLLSWIKPKFSVYNTPFELSVEWKRGILHNIRHFSNVLKNFRKSIWNVTQGRYFSTIFANHSKTSIGVIKEIM